MTMTNAQVALYAAATAYSSDGPRPRGGFPIPLLDLAADYKRWLDTQDGADRVAGVPSRLERVADRLEAATKNESIEGRDD